MAVNPQGFGPTLDMLMRRRNLTKSALAKRARVPRSTIYRHLGGDQPEEETLRKYAPVLAIDAEQLIKLATGRGHLPGRVHALATVLSDLDDETIERIFAVLTVVREERRVG